MSNISRSQFHRYVRIQMSGKVNMQDIETVCSWAGLTPDAVKAIQADYERCLERFGEPDAAQAST